MQIRSATIARFSTLWVRPSTLVCVFNWHKSLESHNGEKEIKARNSCKVWLRPRAPEKRNEMDFACPYQEPRKVPLAEKAKAFQGNSVKGTRQNSPVSSV